MNIDFKRLTSNAKTPTYGSEFAAGADLYSAENQVVIVNPGKTVFIHTGIAVAIPEGYVGLVYARSGIACKRGLAPANKVGVIDSDYRGEIMVALHNHGNTAQKIEPGERIAQIIISPYITASFRERDELDGTERGDGGFGSTGVY